MQTEEVLNRTAEEAERHFSEGNYATAKEEYEKLRHSSFQPLAELRLSTLKIVSGTPQEGLEEIAKLTQELSDSQGVPHPFQWSMVVLALLMNRLVSQAHEALHKFPDLSSCHIARMRWLLGAVMNIAEEEKIELGDLEPAPSERALPGEMSLSLDSFLSLVSHAFVNAGLVAEVPKLINSALQKEILPSAVERIGSEYGGWVIPRGSVSRSSICYCVGVGEDVSFDLGLISQFGCAVHAFDPTPRSQAFVSSSVSNEQFRFYPIGLWNEDTTLTFFSPENPEHVSHSVHDLQATSTPGFKAKVERLSTIMKSLNHSHVDLLKMDIEGAEYPVVKDLLDEGMQVSTLCIEYHELPGEPSARLHSIRALQSGGFELIHIEHNNYTFKKRERVQVKSGEHLTDTWITGGVGHYTCEDEMYLQYFKRLLPEFRGGKVLEVGPGTGEFAYRLMSQFNITEYVILDIERNIADSKRFLESKGMNIPLTFVTSANYQSLFSHEFDLIVSNVCIPETPKEYREDLLNTLIPKTRNAMIIGQFRGKWVEGDEYERWIKDLFASHFNSVLYELTPYKNCYVLAGKNLSFS